MFWGLARAEYTNSNHKRAVAATFPPLKNTSLGHKNRRLTDNFLELRSPSVCAILRLERKVSVRSRNQHSFFVVGFSSGWMRLVG